MRQLIINADDFGMNAEVNEGIKKAIEAGMVNSVSVMVNMPCYEDAVSYLKNHSEIAVGLHFNVTEGQPISRPLETTSLLREDNNFFSWPYQAIKLLRARKFLKDVEVELMAQYKKLKKTGLVISHIDSHNHIHLHPKIYNRVMKFAHGHSINFLRSRSFSVWGMRRILGKKLSPKQIFILILCFINSRLYKNESDIQEIQSIYDVSWDNKLNARKFKNIIQNLPDGITEIICHPATLSKYGNPRFFEIRYRILNVLLDPSVKNYIASQQVEFLKRTMRK